MRRSAKRTIDEDVFIARMNPVRGVVDLRVFASPGTQTVVGAVWTGGRLVMGGTCGGSPAGVCETASGQSWLAGFDP